MSSAQVGALGIDFGSLRTSIAVAKRGGVDIILNEASSRETANVVSFGDNERFLGDQGYIRMKSNLKNTVTYFNRYLGMKVDSPHVQEEGKWMTCGLGKGKDNKVTFDVNYQGERRSFLPEQVTGTMLQKIKQIINKNGLQANDMVISVPSFFTEQERKALLDAARVAEINVVRLFNEESAIAISYGLFRKRELDNNARNVVFVDFGHSKTTAFVGAFTSDKLKILCQVHERHLGCRDFDWFLLEHFSKKFQSQADGLNPMKNDKARTRLLEAIEKQRKILSACPEAVINVEYLMEDFDFNEIITRDDFEKLIAPMLEKFRGVLKGLAEEIKTKKLNIHSVEIVGGGSRIPCVQRIIQEVFNVPTLQKTLNASESISRGCAMQSAMLSPLFKVAEYGVEEMNIHPIRCTWQFFGQGSKLEKMEVEDGKNELEKQTAILFDKGCSIPNTKSLTFHKDQGIHFKMFYDPSPAGFSSLLASYTIQPPKPKEKEFSTKIRISLNKHGVVELEEANLLEDFWEEVVVPKEQPKPQAQAPKADEKPAQQTQPSDQTQQQAQPQQPESNEMTQEKPADPKPAETKPETEIQKKKKTRHSKLKFDKELLNQNTDKEIQDFFEFEAKMFNHDRLIVETHEKKNELESYVYELRVKINESHKQYTPPGDDQKLLLLLTENETWLYGEGASASKGQYVKRIEQIQNIWNPIMKRFNSYQELPGLLKDLVQTLNEFEQLAQTTDPKYEHITPEDRGKIFEEAQKIKNWIAEADRVQSTMARYQDPVIQPLEVSQKLGDFQYKASQIMNKPKPEPPKEKVPEKNPSTEKAEPQKSNPEEQKQPQGGDSSKMDIE